MKSFLVTVALLLSVVSSAVAAPNISGIWDSVQDDPNVSDLVFTISQVGNQVVATTFFKFKGEPCVWGGSGTVQGSKFVTSQKYGRRYHDWPKGTDGRLELTISSDGTTLTGNWYNELGQSGAVKYKKVR